MPISDPSLLRMRGQLWARARSSVERRLGPPSNELRAYEERYRGEFRDPGTPLSRSEAIEAACGAPVLLCGDYHSYAPAQATCLELLRASAARSGEVQLFVELALTRHQRHIDAYLSGDIDETVAVMATDKAAVFEVSLEAGPTKLQTWFIDADGAERGAYFCYVERL